MCVEETCPLHSKNNNINSTHPSCRFYIRPLYTGLDWTISKESTTNCWRMWLHCFDLPLRGMLEENECYSFEADPQKRKQRLMYDLMDKTANRVWCCLESSRICVQKHLPLIYDHERSSSSSLLQQQQQHHFPAQNYQFIDSVSFNLFCNTAIRSSLFTISTSIMTHISFNLFINSISRLDISSL